MFHPDYHSFITTLALAGTLLFLPLILHADNPKAKLPNIVFILADDMGYGDLACQNPETKIPTPNLDRLANQGMRFTDAHSPSAVCSPTRYSILTGRYCWRSRLKRGVLWCWNKPLIEPNRLTVGQLLKDAGYKTACIGKWHLGWNWPLKEGTTINRKSSGTSVDFTKPIGGGPLTVGFDYYFGDDVPNFPPYCYIENHRTIGIPTLIKPDSMHGQPGIMLKGWQLDAVMPAITRKAVDYIDNRAKDAPAQPFFLYFALTAPHTPIAPAKEFQGKSQAGPYGDFVFQVDHTVGEILRALKRTHLTDNTLVIFTSDNGSPGRDGTDMAGKFNSVRRYGHNPSRPWRGIKADAWDGGHRVPFIARWPGKIPAGQVNDELICHVDFMATVADILNKKLPADAAEDSYSLLDVLQGKQLTKPLREAVIHHSSHGLFCVRQGKWKLILGLGAGGFSGPIRKPKPTEPKGQLYNLSSDPAEQNNLYDAHPEVVQKLTGILERYKKTGRSAPR
ncbi:MAG: sulfatase family protein [Planctomycetota bacterium]|jgi:arylsulfatase A-like enzyme